MILKSTIQQIASIQRKNLVGKDTGLTRNALRMLPDLSSHALIISGIRRCGKSTLLFQLLDTKYSGAFYLNFEDPRLYEFELNDFLRLDEIISESGSKVLLFDEIQIISEWERYIRQKLDENYKVVLTGSNASLLSKELGTKLTGRHISKELFPFSYQEYCSFQGESESEKSLNDYLEIGGFPEYVKSRQPEILNQLFDDILVRDIAVRYGVRDIKSLQRLALHLISNVGNLITANKLKNMFEIGAASTVMEYLSYLEYSYLLFLVPKFSYSLRKQIVNPRKVYMIDTGLVKINSVSFSKDIGRRFENLIFLHLRREYKDIYYYSEKGECDFIISEKGVIVEVIQVCYNLNPDNLNRELKGLLEAMEFFKLKEGTIITWNQEDRIEKKGKIVNVVSCNKYFHTSH